MKIEIKSPSIPDYNLECISMYQAHTHKVYREANGYQTDIYVDGYLQEHLPEDLIHPDAYSVITNSIPRTMADERKSSLIVLQADMTIEEIEVLILEIKRVSEYMGIKLTFNQKEQ